MALSQGTWEGAPLVSHAAVFVPSRNDGEERCVMRQKRLRERLVRRLQKQNAAGFEKRYYYQLALYKVSHQLILTA